MTGELVVLLLHASFWFVFFIFVTRLSLAAIHAGYLGKVYGDSSGFFIPLMSPTPVLDWKNIFVGKNVFGIFFDCIVLLVTFVLLFILASLVFLALPGSLYIVLPLLMVVLLFSVTLWMRKRKLAKQNFAYTLKGDKQRSLFEYVE